MGCGQTKSAADVWSKEDFAKYDEVKRLWASIDLDDSGFIEVRELKMKMEKQGKHVDMKSLKLAFNLVDEDHTGRISFDEFCRFNGLRVTKEIKAHLNSRKEAHFPNDPIVEEARRRTDGHGHLTASQKMLMEHNRSSRRMLTSQKFGRVESGGQDPLHLLPAPPSNVVLEPAN